MREGETVPSKFHLRQITFDPAVPTSISSMEMPIRSGVVALLGSGSQSVRMWLDP
jgi:hypothetical protein